METKETKIETKIEIIIKADGKIVSWWSPEFEELISEVATEKIGNREGGSRPVEGFPFHPEFCG